MARSQFSTELGQLANRDWRIDHLYSIVDAAGNLVQFNLNPSQQHLYNCHHALNIILKARQLGFSTFISIYILDELLFNSNIAAGLMAHNEEAAKAILRKYKVAYDNLPEVIRRRITLVTDSVTMLVFSNGSSIRVSTTPRSATFNLLHISEFGIICAKDPIRADEIMSGALNAVAPGQKVFIESTAYGKGGYFYDLCERAQQHKRSGRILTQMDWHFAFYPWQADVKYTLQDSADIPQHLVEYLDGIKNVNGTDLNHGQRSWYAKKADDLQETMKREFPSTATEAFETALEGAYYGEQLARAEVNQQIGVFPADNEFTVDSAWDLGIADMMSIWIFQVTAYTIRVVGFIEGSGEPINWYLDQLQHRGKAKGWKYKTHWFPHDAKVRELVDGLTRIEEINLTVRSRSMGKAHIVDSHKVADGIQAVRKLFPKFRFDEAMTGQGIDHLRSYRKQWNDAMGVWRDEPRHDEHSHAADAFRYLAMSTGRGRSDPTTTPPSPASKIFAVGGPENGCTATLNDMWDADAKRRRQRRRL